MHELAIAESVIGLVSAEAKDKGFQKVISIRLRMGEYAGIVPECLREFFPFAAKGSVAEGAELEIEAVPAAFRCTDCGYEGAIDRRSACCPECGSFSVRMTAGREFFVESLKVE